LLAALAVVRELQPARTDAAKSGTKNKRSFIFTFVREQFATEEVGLLVIRDSSASTFSSATPPD
jgi:hypothetical protein